MAGFLLSLYECTKRLQDRETYPWSLCRRVPAREQGLHCSARKRARSFLYDHGRFRCFFEESNKMNRALLTGLRSRRIILVRGKFWIASQKGPK